MATGVSSIMLKTLRTPRSALDALSVASCG